MILSHYKKSSLALVAALLLSATVWGQAMSRGILSPPSNVRPPGLQNVGFEQKLNGQIPVDLIFRDETGKTVHLGDYFGKRPLILNLVYFRCPMLCGEVLSGLTSSMRILKFDIGNEFDVLTVSFDPRETPELATAKKAEYLKRYGRPGAAEGWHFLTGDQANIEKLTNAVGFQYQFDPKTGQFAHVTAIMVLTPQGKIWRGGRAGVTAGGPGHGRNPGRNAVHFVSRRTEAASSGKSMKLVGSGR